MIGEDWKAQGSLKPGEAPEGASLNRWEGVSVLVVLALLHSGLLRRSHVILVRRDLLNLLDLLDGHGLTLDHDRGANHLLASGDVVRLDALRPARDGVRRREGDAAKLLPQGFEHIRQSLRSRILDVVEGGEAGTILEGGPHALLDCRPLCGHNPHAVADDGAVLPVGRAVSVRNRGEHLLLVLAALLDLLDLKLDELAPVKAQEVGDALVSGQGFDLGGELLDGVGGVHGFVLPQV